MKKMKLQNKKTSLTTLFVLAFLFVNSIFVLAEITVSAKPLHKVNADNQTENLTEYVQTMAGTALATSPDAVKHGKWLGLFGNTIPAVTTPFAMTQWTPQTQLSETKCVPPYYYKDELFSGIRGSHWISGSCTQDYGSVTIMPTSGSLNTKPTVYQAKFSHADEVSTPYQYSINLKKYGIKTSVTSTDRCGILEFKAEKSDSIYLLITPNSDEGEGSITVDNKSGEIYGFNPVHRIYQGWGKKAGFNGFFVIKLERLSNLGGTFVNDKVSLNKSISNKKNIGAYVGFKMQKGEVLRIKVGTSFSSIEGARKNLQTEIPGWNYNEILAKNKAQWEKALGQVKVKSTNEKDKRIFYTALYHSMQQPRLYNDVDGVYPRFATQYKLEKVAAGNYYDDFSLWDTYRAHLPLMEIIQPEFVNNMVQSLIIKGQQGGYLSIFPCWNSYTSEMIGDHSTSVIASAYLKGISKSNKDEAYRLMRQNAFDIPASRADYEDGKGRRALDSYLKYKYIPVEDSVPDAYHEKEQVSRTLEYAYDDYALALMSKKMGKSADYQTLIERAGYYANVFDKEVGMVRGKHIDGSWVSPFVADKRQYYITEGTPRQYTFYVPHDVQGLANLMGGSNKLEASLDSIFSKKEYWHGNEPSHQISFMYNYTASPWKTQLQVRKILDEAYIDGPNGLLGNDDVGQMSAWYLFSSIGFYPLNPVSGEYLLCSPIFDNVSIQLNNGKKFDINVYKKGSSSQYIYDVKLNGKSLNRSYIKYDEIKNGGKLSFFLQDMPDLNWATGADARPSGMSK
ncbi:MAG: GH92 family glycosyl hydrolase [Salinivirgaceae bacterium]|jgi:predicted alpha-1,2-mannosidase|nr:GH92 family glycosyl hydrolase [Salinivirgaceae bacterium]